MTKLRTLWKRRGQQSNPTDVDSSAVTYNSSTTQYADSGQSPESETKERTLWDRRAKSRTDFQVNSAADANAQAYDTATAYDSVLTYDTIVAGEARSSSKQPTAWSAA